MHNTNLPMSAHWLKEIESKTEITVERGLAQMTFQNKN